MISTSVAKRIHESDLEQPPRPRALAFPRLFGRKLTVNVVADPRPFGVGASGVREAFQECLDGLRAHPDLDLQTEDQRPADILHYIGCGPAFFYRSLRATGRKICTVHLTSDGGSLAELARPAVESYLKAACNRADAVIATTAEVSARLRNLGVRSPIRTIPGALPEGFAPSRELRRRGRARLGLAGEQLVVLGVGGLRREDGVADFAAVARELPEALFLWVDQETGSGPSDPAVLDAFVASGPSNLRFAGTPAPADLPAIFNAADVLFHPALRADRPRTPLAGAACGLPLVLRQLPEHRALLKGELLVAADVPGFVSAVRRLLSSTTERKRWAALSRRLSAPYGLLPVVDTVAELYDLAACGKFAPKAAEPEASTTRLLEWPL